MMIASAAGYRSLGWPSGGRIADGVLADFVVVRSDSVRTTGARLDQIGYAATAADFDQVVVAGQVIVREGQHRLGSPARLLTADHTAEAAAAAGTLDPAVAALRPGAITRWLGADGDAEPEVVALSPGAPGALLLCTDGLWKYLPDAAALTAVALPALSRGGALAAAAALTAAALSAGGADNVTVAVLPVPFDET